MEWEPEKSETKKVDTYDCRTRSWYIETATCSKDVVILLDNSGSMTGYRNYIAQLTVKSVLDTFSNNDFLTIFNYSNTVDDLVPCFKVSVLFCIELSYHNIIAFLGHTHPGNAGEQRGVQWRCF